MLRAVIMYSMSDRTCAICGETYPLDKKHFRLRERDGQKKFSAECRLCIAKAKREAADRKKAKQDAELQAIEEAGVGMFLKAMGRGGSNIPHSAEVIEKVMEYFGGVSGFSAVMVKQYWDSPPGGSARNKLIETMCRLVAKNVEQGGAKKPLTLWSEEELEQELDNRFKQAIASYTGVTIDALPEKTPESLPAPGPEHPGPDTVPEGIPQGTPRGTAGQEVRGLKALPPEPEPREDPSVEGQ